MLPDADLALTYRKIFVAEPLNGIVPPLPILQVPTPPKASPPFTGANIRPKKIGYFWTGPGDKGFKDFLVTLSLDDVSRRGIEQTKTD